MADPRGHRRRPGRVLFEDQVQKKEKDSAREGEPAQPAMRDEWLAKAKEGDFTAQRHVALGYARGEDGFPQNLNEAFRWFTVWLGGTPGLSKQEKNKQLMVMFLEALSLYPDVLKKRKNVQIESVIRFIFSYVGPVENFSDEVAFCAGVFDILNQKLWGVPRHPVIAAAFNQLAITKTDFFIDCLRKFLSPAFAAYVLNHLPDDVKRVLNSEVYYDKIYQFVISATELLSDHAELIHTFDTGFFVISRDQEKFSELHSLLRSALSKAQDGFIHPKLEGKGVFKEEDKIKGRFFSDEEREIIKKMLKDLDDLKIESKKPHDSGAFHAGLINQISQIIKKNIPLFPKNSLFERTCRHVYREVLGEEFKLDEPRAGPRGPAAPQDS